MADAVASITAYRRVAAKAVLGLAIALPLSWSALAEAEPVDAARILPGVWATTEKGGDCSGSSAWVIFFPDGTFIAPGYSKIINGSWDVREGGVYLQSSDFRMKYDSETRTWRMTPSERTGPEKMEIEPDGDNRLVVTAKGKTNVLHRCAGADTFSSL